MQWRRLLLPLLASALLLPREARAIGGLVSVPTEAAQQVEAKIALAVSPSRTTRWLSLRVHGPAATAMWLLPVRPGARVDNAPEAFLEALEDATAPRILPPPEPPACGVMPLRPEVHGDSSRHVTHRAADVIWLEGAMQAAAHAESLGLAVTRAMVEGLEELSASGYEFIAMRHVSLAGDSWLSPIRIVDDAPPVLPLLLTGAGSEPLRMTAFVIGAGRASFGTSAALAVDPASVIWRRNGTSSYLDSRDEALGAGQGRWLVESAGHGLVFAATNLPKSTRPIPSLIGAYLSREGKATDSDAACVTRIGALAGRQERVGLACPEGALASPVEPCIESPRLGEIDAAVLRCEGAEELALALSGLRPSEVVVTRAVGMLRTGSFGQDVHMTLSPGPELSPLVATTKYESCESGIGDSPSEEPGGGSAPSPWLPPPFPSEDDVYEPEEEETIAWTDVVFGCESSTEPDYDDWGSEDSCSSGTGGSGWDDSDESCGSGGYGGSSDDEYDSCEGSGGYEDSGEDEECSVARKRRRPFRPRLSVYTLLLAAIVLPIRRRTRPNRQRQS